MTIRGVPLDEIVLTMAQCHSRCGTIKSPPCFRQVASKGLKFAALHQLWLRSSMSETFLNGMLNNIQSINHWFRHCRHTAYLIHSLHPFLSAAEKKDICRTLEQLTTQTDDGNCQSLALDNGMIIPPVSFTTIPYVKWVTWIYMYSVHMCNVYLYYYIRWNGIF